MTAEEQIKERFENSRFFDSDPRSAGKYLDTWNHTHDWFVLKCWDDLSVKLWVDVGYGFYALQEGERIVGFGKDMIQTENWIMLGEYYGDKPVLAKIVA